MTKFEHLSPMGLGESNAQFNVYMANRPMFEFADGPSGAVRLQAGEIHAIGQACGNGWRKVFNVYAKIVFALSSSQWPLTNDAQRWQAYRDNTLLQSGSNTALWFAGPECVTKAHMTDATSRSHRDIHVIMGRTFARSLTLPDSMIWMSQEFALDTPNRTIVCPYFDYRQLSNQHIVRLVEIIKMLR